MLAGGEPTPEELAALVLALTPSTRVAADRDEPSSDEPAWAVAGRREGVADLRITTRWGLAGPLV